MDIVPGSPHVPAHYPVGGPPLLRGEEVVQEIFSSALHSMQVAEEGRSLSLKELMSVNALTREEVPQFLEVIKNQRVALQNRITSTPEQEETKAEDLKNLDILEKLAPLFQEHKSKTDAVWEAFDLARTSSCDITPFLAVSHWQAIALPFLDWVDWSYKHRPPCLHQAFRETLYEYHVQGLGNLVDDHYTLAKKEYDYLKGHLSTPPTVEELFQLACLESTIKQAQEGLAEMPEKIQHFITWFEQIPNRTSDQEKGLGRLRSIQRDLLSKQAAYAVLSGKIERLKETLPQELTAQAQNEYDALTPEAREAKRVELVGARPPIQRGFLGRICHNITHPDEWSEETRAVLGVVLRALQISQHAIGVYSRAERSWKVTQWEAAGEVFKQAQRELPEELWEEVVSGVKEEMQALLEGRVPDGWEAPLTEAARRDQIYEYGRELLVQRLNVARETYKNLRLAPAPESIPDTPEKVMAVAAPFFQIQEAIGDASRALGLQESDQCYDQRESSRRMIQAFGSEERKALEEAITALDAALEDMGAKYRNVFHQMRLVELLQLPGIKVPVPQGIGSTQMHAFLQATQPEIFTYWDELKGLYEQAENKNQFLKEPEIQRRLALIDQSLQTAFRDPSAFEKLQLDPSIKEWLTALRSQGGSLMIRSTGAEDTRESANAGGNLSVPYVAPTEEAFTSSVGDVVRSYFSERSLQNRINAGRNPFAEPLKLAVMAQEVIGERIGGTNIPSEIPRSLVLFTNEPLYIGGEPFRAMRLSASYGHGEGVVGEQGIGTDTITVLFSLSQPDKLYILYDNHEKPERLAPIRGEDGTVSLQKVPNPPELQRRRVFNEEEVKHLVRWALIGEAYYHGEATDMELVTKEIDGQFVIFPVQARPVNRPPPGEATYLDRTKLGEIATPQIRAETIVPGSAVITLTKAEELLVAPSLEEAERLFRKGVHKAVLVGRDEPANSHPVVNFSNLGIPCFYFRGDTSAFLKGLRAGKQAVVCTQTATFQIVEREQMESLISKGFIVHPARLGTSLSLTERLHSKKVVQSPMEATRTLLFNVNTAKSNREALEQLEALKNSEALCIFHERAKQLKSRCQGMAIIPEEVKRTLLTIEELEEHLKMAFNEVRQAYSTREGRLEPLLHVKVLGGLLFQPKEAMGALGRHSVESLLHAIEGAQEILDYHYAIGRGDRPTRFTPWLLEGNEQPDASLYAEWKEFLKGLETDAGLNDPDNPEAQQSLRGFEQTLTALQTTHTLPTWLLFFFRESAGQLTRKRLEALTIPEQELSSLTPLIEQGKRYTSLQNRLPSLTSRAGIEAFATELKREAEALHVDSLAWDPNASPIKRVLFLNNMNSFVNLYDSAIKEMKRSPLEATEKVQLFKQMLRPYYELMASWTTLLPLTETGGETPIESYLRTIKNTLDRSRSDEVRQLDPSRGFSVSAAKLGSEAFFGLHRPETLEDLFTLCHQNLLVVTSSLFNRALSLTSLQKGEMLFLTEAARELEQMPGQYRASRIGVTQEEDQVALHYNVPLRYHAAGVNLIYRKGEGVVFEALFLGRAGDRWPALLTEIHALDMLGLLSLTEPPTLTESELRFACHWKGGDSLPLQLFQEGIRVSFEKTRESQFTDRILKERGDSLDLPEILERVRSALPFVQKGSESSSAGVRHAATRLISELLNKGLSLQDALPFVQKGLEDSSDLVRREATWLVSKLLDKGLSLQDALPLVQKVLEDSSDSVRSGATWLISKLPDKGLSLQDALSIVQKGLENSPVQLQAIDIIGKVDKGVSIQEVLPLVQRAFWEYNDLDRTGTEREIRALIDKLIITRLVTKELNDYASGSLQRVIDALVWWAENKLPPTYGAPSGRPTIEAILQALISVRKGPEPWARQRAWECAAALYNRGHIDFWEFNRVVTAPFT